MNHGQRLEWIDAIRGIGILTVILFHSGFLPFIRFTNPLLISWMLPAFIFTGGWLIKDLPLTRQRMISLVRRLLTPFFVSGGISFLGWLVLRNLYPQNVLHQPASTELLKWLTGRNPYFNSPLWFLPTYLFASLFMQGIAGWWFRRSLLIKSAVAVICISLGFLLSHAFKYPLFSYDLIVLFIGMMMAGSIASQVRIPRAISRFVFDLSMVIAFVGISLSNGYIDMFQRQFGNDMLYLLSAALGTYSFVRILSLPILQKNILIQFSKKLGKSSLTLLSWHWPSMQWLTYGLFATGLLRSIVTEYTKTSFSISGGGSQFLVLQLFFCVLYTVISLFIILLLQSFHDDH